MSCIITAQSAVLDPQFPVLGPQFQAHNPTSPNNLQARLRGPLRPGRSSGPDAYDEYLCGPLNSTAPACGPPDCGLRTVFSLFAAR